MAEAKRRIDMSRYFIISGLENGLPITPYVTESDTLPYEICNPPYGDISLSYEEISSKKYHELLEEGE